MERECSGACGAGEGLAPCCLESWGILLMAVVLHFVFVLYYNPKWGYDPGDVPKVMHREVHTGIRRCCCVPYWEGGGGRNPELIVGCC